MAFDIPLQFFKRDINLHLNHLLFGFFDFFEAFGPFGFRGRLTDQTNGPGKCCNNCYSD